MTCMRGARSCTCVGYRIGAVDRHSRRCCAMCDAIGEVAVDVIGLLTCHIRLLPR
jgi:hypothetical protein